MTATPASTPAAGRLVAALLATALAAGCATTPEPDGDPFEGVNRKVFGFNQALDEHVLEPVADTYVKVTPQPVREGVSNFFDNARYPNVIINDFLQGKGRQGTSDLWRFIINSTVGVLGIFDPASSIGLEEHDEDFGQTLGVWGSEEGPYYELPLLGPSTGRDVPGVAMGFVTNGLFYVSSAAVTVPLGVLGVIDTRARVDKAVEIRKQVALDPYAFTRSAYRQRRIDLIYDGDPPAIRYEELLEFDD